MSVRSTAVVLKACYFFTAADIGLGFFLPTILSFYLFVLEPTGLGWAYETVGLSVPLAFATAGSSSSRHSTTAKSYIFSSLLGSLFKYLWLLCRSFRSFLLFCARIEAEAGRILFTTPLTLLLLFALTAPICVGIDLHESCLSLRMNSESVFSSSNDGSICPLIAMI